MLVIWHGGDFLKKDLAQPIYGRVEHGSPILGLLIHSLIRCYFFSILCVNVLVYIWILWLMYP